MIRTRIKISYLPGLESYAGYENNFYSCQKLYEIESPIDVIRTQDEWEDTRNLGSENVAIQAKIQQRYELIFSTTESLKTELIEMGGIVEIFPENEDSYKAFNITLSKERKKGINTYVNTLQFSKYNEKYYIDYLASNYVKTNYADLSVSNYVNYVSFLVENTPYTQRSEGVNATIATLDYNFKFALNDETSQISVADKFYAIINDAQIRAQFATQDYRCSCVYIDSDYIYFKFDTIPIIVFDEIEIQISGEPNGEVEHSVPTANIFEGKIYTFLRPKLSNDFDPGESFEQIPGIVEYSNLIFYRVRKVLMFLKPEEDYLYQKLLMCEPKNISFSEFDMQGGETKYYPITMNNFAVLQPDNNLKDLTKFELTITYNNTPTNVNRPTV